MWPPFAIFPSPLNCLPRNLTDIAPLFYHEILRKSLLKQQICSQCPRDFVDISSCAPNMRGDTRPHNQYTYGSQSAESQYGSSDCVKGGHSLILLLSEWAALTRFTRASEIVHDIVHRKLRPQRRTIANLWLLRFEPPKYGFAAFHPRQHYE